jgi:hypothetical protein
MNMPGFTAERSLFGSSGQRVTFCDSGCHDAIRPEAVGSFGRYGATTWPDPAPDFENGPDWPGSPLIAAESVPGGPSTVPSGYERVCRRVPYTVCVGNRCWTEYGWVCTLYPLPRAQ